jgi:hypothetical protein
VRQPDKHGTDITVRRVASLRSSICTHPECGQIHERACNCGYLKVLERLTKALTFLDTLATASTGFDLNPTMMCRREDVESEYLAYLKRIDESIRQRAREALQG